MTTRALVLGAVCFAFACAPKEAPPKTATSIAANYKHGSHSGPGKGGGDRGGKGDKLGAGGFKHGSKLGAGNGGGAKQAKGEKTGRHSSHGTGKGDGTGGGDRGGKGGAHGAKLKEHDQPASPAPVTAPVSPAK